MRILHLSDTPLSGAPLRLSNMLKKHNKDVMSAHVTWTDKVGYRDFGYDLLGCRESKESLDYLIYEWADIIHYHNRWKRQEIFKFLGKWPPKKPSVIQIHSPRFSEGFLEEINSGVPLAVIAQYHVRQWPELSYIVPNVVDITELAPIKKPASIVPKISFAPSNTTCGGWDNKGYHEVMQILKPMKHTAGITLDLINQRPFSEAIERKAYADLGIDEIVTGSYHLSGLEYLALGVGCFSGIDAQTEKVLKDLTGCAEQPFIRADKNSFKRILNRILMDGSWHGLGESAREWMEKYWSPQLLSEHYLNMYRRL